MLGFLRGIEKGVAREGAAQRNYQSTVLGMGESHLDRLLSQIRYNQQQKRLRERDARQDFVTDRAYDRSVLESDRDHQYREDQAAAAEHRFGVTHAFNKKVAADRNKQWLEGHLLRKRADNRDRRIFEYNYGPGGYMDERRKQEADRHKWAGEVQDFNYGPGGYMEERRKREGEVHDLNYGEDGMQVLRRDLFQAELDDYVAGKENRGLKREYDRKLLEYSTGAGFDEMIEDKSLQQDLIRAQIGAYNRRGTTTTGLPDALKPYKPTFSQAGDITAESIAPTILRHLEVEGEIGFWKDWGNAQLIPPGFQSDRPWTSTDPNKMTQTRLLRRAGAELVKELVGHRGLSPVNAMQMIPNLWDEFLTTEDGKKILKRLERTASADGYDVFQLREEMRNIIYSGARNYLQFGESDRPAGVETDDADAILDMPLE